MWQPDWCQVLGGQASVNRQLADVLAGLKAATDKLAVVGGVR